MKIDFLNIMNEGTICLAIKFPQPWPVQNRTLLFSLPQGKCILKMYASPDGNLNFVNELQGNILTDYHSQPLAIQGVGLAVLSVTWNNSNVSIHINSKKILDRNPMETKYFRVELKQQIIDATPSFACQDATKLCRNWMEWRKNRYANPKLSAKENRRLKTESEFIEELKNAICSLEDMTTLIQQGKHYLIGHLATELRALVYWNGKNYSPLLLRLAGRLSLPLPVFIVPELAEIPDIVFQCSLRYDPKSVSIIKELPTQVIVDLQEWLSTEIITLKVLRGDMSNEVLTEDVKTVKDIILDTATVLGAAHYDEDLPDTLEIIYKLESRVGRQIDNLLLQVAFIVIKLGQYVLDKNRM